MKTRHQNRPDSPDLLSETRSFDEPAPGKRTGDAGMTTAEYAVGTIAAVAFAAVLYKIVQSPEVHDMLVHIVTSALNIRL